MLEQDIPNGRHPVAFTSRTLNNAEQNYAPHELELLAIVDTLRAWRSHLHGRKLRWLEQIVEFDFDVIPILEKCKTVANALFREAKDLPSKEEYKKDLLKLPLQKMF